MGCLLWVQYVGRCFKGEAFGGAIFAASMKLAQRCAPGNIVTIFSDRGDGYFTEGIYGSKIWFMK